MKGRVPVRVESTALYSSLFLPSAVSDVWRRALFQDLTQRFSFAPPSASYRRSRGSRWDGTVSFFNPSSAYKRKARFPTGLLPEVSVELRSRNCILLREDKREQPPAPLEQLNVEKYERMGGVQLRSYQMDAINAVLRSRYGVVQAATGSGKTVMFLGLVHMLQQHYAELGLEVPQAVIFFRSKQLVEQTRQAALELGLEDVGTVHSTSLDVDRKLVLSTVQSSHKLPPSLVNSTRILMADEVQDFSSKSSMAALRRFKKYWMRVGFSATPWKDDQIHNYRIKSWLGPSLVEISTQRLIDANLLSGASCVFYKVAAPEKVRDMDWQDAVVQGIVENENLNETITSIVGSLEGRVMILVRRLKHGDILFDKISRLKNTVCHWVQGADDLETRDYVLNKLREPLDSDNVKRVVGILSPIGSVGVNVYIHHLINAVGGKDPSTTIQIMGRGLRKAPDKEHLTYIDFAVSNNKYLSRHARQRINTLRDEGHKVEVKKTKYS